MGKTYFLLYIIFLNILLIKSSRSILGKLSNIQCLVYIQSFNDFINFQEPSYVIHASCKYCIVYKISKKNDDNDKNSTKKILPINGKFNSIAFGCVGEGYDESLILIETSLLSSNECSFNDKNIDKMFNCTKNLCCCRGFDCHDKLMNRARLGFKIDQDQKCFIERKLLNEYDPKLQNEYDSKAFMNYHCSVCGLILKNTYFETLCIKENDVEISCGKFNKFVGGKLACNNDGTNCCCRDSIMNCTESFRKYAYNQTESLGKPLLFSPYTKLSCVLFFNWWWIIIFLTFLIF